MNLTLKYVSLLLVAGLMAHPGSARPVNCDDSAAKILERIEGYDPIEDRAILLEQLRCLLKPAEDLASDTDRLMSDKTFQDIEEATLNNRLSVIKIIVPLTKVRDRIISDEAAAVLAYYRYPPAKQMLSRYPNGPLKAVLYAILGYGRAYRWAIDRMEWLEHGKDIPDSVSFNEWKAYMNLLYHLAEPGSIFFLDGVIASSQPEPIKKRAEEIKARILKLHPEIK